MTGTGAGNIIGVRAGSDDPTVIAPFRQLIRIMAAHVVGGVLPRQWKIGIEERDIGEEALRQIGAHDTPVIHLHIDVMPVAPRPRRVVILTPGALQIGGQTFLP